ncbi:MULTISPECIES: hypothetical protein [Photorhabdus]|uniref:Uncharacterized protein n=2 Tax=Photorhabdus TaxID=29487 RepID=A0A7X5QQM8_9GAMM|nr:MULTISPECIES: hypothetical protein [Photorhabdus]MQL50121.1 hypothetical protein [Photorhabdus khanii]NHB98766.1 hypothetical protein [Photorhabdus stackebrandtii]
MYIYSGKLKSIWPSADSDLVVIFPLEVEVNQPVIVSWEPSIIVNDNLDESRSLSGVISELEPQEFGFNISIDWGQNFRLIGLIATDKESLIIAMKDENGSTLFTSTLTNLQEQEVLPVVSRLIKNTLQNVPNGIKSLGSTNTILNFINRTSTILNDTDSIWFCQLTDSGDDAVMRTAVNGGLNLGMTAMSLMLPGGPMAAISFALTSTAITAISSVDALWSEEKEQYNGKLPPGRSSTRKSGFMKNNCVYLTRLTILPKNNNRLVLQMYKKDGLEDGQYRIKDIIKEFKPKNMLDLVLDSGKKMVASYSYIQLKAFKITNKPHSQFDMRSNLVNEDAGVWFSCKSTGNPEDLIQGSKFKFDQWTSDIKFSYNPNYVSVVIVDRKYYGKNEHPSAILELSNDPLRQVLRLKSHRVDVRNTSNRKELKHANSPDEVLKIINDNQNYAVWSWEEGGYVYGYDMGKLDEIVPQKSSPPISYVYLKVGFEMPFIKVKSV